ncbi:MAG: VWA domain-containing protein [Proteobacteria bacterium]|nr:VWA domain-containing protein [Pseudomonadota bacterium]
MRHGTSCCGGRSHVLLAVLTLGASLTVGCTDVALNLITEAPPPPFDNKLRLAGHVCTADPAELEFPLKVLFIIDTSQSMNVNDPGRTTPEPRYGETTVVDPTQATGRSRAVRQVITQFINLGVRYSPFYCNTGEPSCGKGSTLCPACTGAGPAMCVGPDCCPIGTDAKECGSLRRCPAPTSTNGVCLPLCDVAKAGCGPGETACADCPTPGTGCVNGVCAAQIDPGVAFAIERFGSAKQVVTRLPNGQPGFAEDPRELLTALPQINNGGSVTDYEGALSEAFQLLSRDMAEMRRNNTGALNRSRYVVIFLSDGQPDPRINDREDWGDVPPEIIRELLGDQAQYAGRYPQYNVPTGILRRVNDIMSLKALYPIGDLKLHTAYLASQTTTGVFQDQAIALLKQMADVGQGTFRNFLNGEEINFLHVDFSTLRRVFRLKNLIASNLNGRPTATTTVTDSDGDGLDDELERTIGTKVYSGDSDGDGFGDALEHFFRSSGADALNPGDADCNAAASDLDGDGVPDDSDGDGLHDCEERFLGTSRDLFDSDADGIPDNVEVRFGTNPVADDTLDDLDFDGMPNGDELRLHSDPRSDDAAHRSRIGYRYDIQRTGTGIEQEPTRCSADADCPQGRDCGDGFCRCSAVGDCSSLTACSADGECTLRGERCQSSHCVGSQRCETQRALAGDQPICTWQRHVTCYDWTAENITLVDPRGVSQDGWNTLQIAFGQVPFDNPKDYGVFSIACVRARYDAQTGAKLPPNGQIRVPESAWKDPRLFDAAKDCVCPAQDLACPAP